MPDGDLRAHGAQHLHRGGVFYIGTGNHGAALGKNSRQPRHARATNADKVNAAEIVVCGISHLLFLPSGGGFGLGHAGSDAVCDGIGHVAGAGVGGGMRHRC